MSTQEMYYSYLCICKWIALFALCLQTLARWCGKLTPKSVSAGQTKSATIALLSADTLNNSEICSVSNTYANLPSKYHLVATGQDVEHMENIVFNGMGEQYRNLSAQQIVTTLEKTVLAASHQHSHCIIYLSMHGMGGIHSCEYIIGDDGRHVSEDRIRQILETKGRNAKSIIAIIDACHSGGLFNMCHTYSYGADGQMQKISQLSDMWGTSERCVNLETPCFVITAVQEDQVAQATNRGSIFTNELTTAIHENPRGTSVNTILCIVAKQCNKTMHKYQLDYMNPVCSFNDSFYKRIQREVNISTPEDILDCVALI